MFGCCCVWQLTTTKSSLEVASLPLQQLPLLDFDRGGIGLLRGLLETLAGEPTHNHGLHVTAFESFFLGTYHHVVVFSFAGSVQRPTHSLLDPYALTYLKKTRL